MTEVTRFTLAAAMNPCPCGHLGDPTRDCICDPSQVARHRSRISGPLRGGGGAPCWNAALSPSRVRAWWRPDEAGRRHPADASARLGLSARGIHRVLKVARTVADLEGSRHVAVHHLAEAVGYRVNRPEFAGDSFT